MDLADYTFGDDSLDYILNNWKTVDLTSIGSARLRGFDLCIQRRRPVRYQHSDVCRNRQYRYRCDP